MGVLELKPCPFCGGKAYVWPYLGKDNFIAKYDPKMEKEYNWYAQCKSCMAKTMLLGSKENAMGFWNHRVGG